MRKMWFGLLAITAVASIQSVGCGSGESSGSTGSGGAAATSSTSASTASSSAAGTGGAGGSGATTATSSSTTAASSSSASGTGGGGGCDTAADCPMLDTECKTATCTQGVCGFDNVADQTPTAGQSAGDCQKLVCDGQGSVTSIKDDTDVPNDNKQCTADACNAGVPASTSLAIGTACAEGNGKLCNGAGKCVECLVDSECATGLCSAGVCSMINGCAPATATDLTASANTVINFGGALGLSYAPKCIKVKAGSKVTLTGSFSSHPFIGGEVKNGAKVVAVSGPFIPVTNDAAIPSKTFTMSTAGTYPYYCDFHALGGMTGVVFVVP
jgi:plastocyanin